MEDEEEVRPSMRKSGRRSRRGKFVGFLISSRRCRLRWRRFPVILLPRKVAGIYAEIVLNMIVNGIQPTVMFTSQWGLPVLSQPALGFYSKKDVGTKQMSCIR